MWTNLTFLLSYKWEATVNIHGNHKNGKKNSPLTLLLCQGSPPWNSLEQADDKQPLLVHEGELKWIWTTEATFKPTAWLTASPIHTHHSLFIDTAGWWELSQNLLRSRGHALYTHNEITQHGYRPYNGMPLKWRFISEKSVSASTVSGKCRVILFRGALLVGALLGCRIAPVHPWRLCLKTPGAETRTCYNAWFRYYSSLNAEMGHTVPAWNSFVLFLF